MYNYRTDGTGNYTYNYNVEDMGGSAVYSNCDMTGKYGYCPIANEDTTVLMQDPEIRQAIEALTVAPLANKTNAVFKIKR